MNDNKPVKGIEQEQMQELLELIIQKLPKDKKFTVALQVLDHADQTGSASICSSPTIAPGSREYAEGIFATANLCRSTGERLMRYFTPVESPGQDDTPDGAAAVAEHEACASSSENEEDAKA